MSAGTASGMALAPCPASTQPRTNPRGNRVEAHTVYIIKPAWKNQIKVVGGRCIHTAPSQRSGGNHRTRPQKTGTLKATILCGGMRHNPTCGPPRRPCGGMRRLQVPDDTLPLSIGRISGRHQRRTFGAIGGSVCPARMRLPKGLDSGCEPCDLPNSAHLYPTIAILISLLAE